MKNKNENAKAIILARVSTKDQEEGHSIEAQLNRLRSYCNNKGFDIIQEFKIVESSTRGGRPEFNKMVEYIKKSKVRLNIVVDTVDRLQRGFKETPIFDELIKASKIRLHFLREAMIFDENSKNSQKIMWDMSVLMAKSYVGSLSDNVKRSFSQMRKEGKWAHHAPIGYLNSKDDSGKSTIILDPDTHYIVKELFTQYAKGIYSLTDIVKMAEKLKLKSDKVHKQTIRNMLSNKFYIGEMRSKGQYIPHIYPKIINMKTFNKCQEVLEGKKNHKIRKHEHIFRGLIFCKNCETLISTDKKGKEKQYSYLFCPKCKGSSVNEAKAIKKVSDSLSKLKTNLNGVNVEIVKRLNEKLNEDFKIEREMSESLKKKITKKKTQQERLLDMCTAESITLDDYQKKLEEYKKEERRLEEILSGYSHINKEVIITLKTLVTLLSNAKELFEISKSDEKREIVKLLFSKMELDTKNLCFSMRKPILALAKMGSRQDWLG